MAKQEAKPAPFPPGKKLSPAQLRFGAAKQETEKKTDPQLGTILQRRKDLYGAGKF